MKIGYACLNLSLPTKFRTCRLATVEKQGLSVIKELTLHNLQETLRAVEWNIENDLLFYRLSSDIVVFASHSVNTWEWWEDEEVLKITSKIKSLQQEHGLRLSCHPGQYNILNSPKSAVVKQTIAELEYHDRLMNLVNGTDIILHVGGVYGDKPAAIERFASHYEELSPSIRSKLRIENDDKSFSIKDVIQVYEKTKAPICFDLHHHRCLPSDVPDETIRRYIQESWANVGTPKMHLSSGKTHPTDRSHHEIIFEEDFRSLLDFIQGLQVDVMIEAKNKELAALEVKKRFDL